MNQSKTPNFAVPLALMLAGTAICNLQSADAQEKEVAVIPGAPRLLPESTLAYIRLDNAEDLRSDLKDSSIGQMLADPKLRPIADDFYGTLRELFEQVSDKVGVTLDELLSIPHGQVAAALIPGTQPEPHDNIQPREDDNDESDEAIQRRLRRKRRELNSFAGVFIVDAGENVDDLLEIIGRLENQVTANGGYIRRDKKVHDFEVTRLLPPRMGRPEIEFVERDGTVVFGIGHRTVQDVLERWDGTTEDPTLADSSNFTSVMSRCVGAESTRPQLTFYVDPYLIAERIVKRSGSFTVGMTWPIIQDLGFERFRGIGGSSFRGGEIFEGISHLHISIDSPRDGLLGVLRPGTGDTKPPKWVPADITTYSTLRWDYDQTYENVGKILERFQGEGAMQRLVEEPTKKRAGVEIQKDIIDNLTGRFCRVTWIEPPARVNSQVGAHALELKDPIAAKSMIATLRERFPNATTTESVAGHVVYFFRNSRKVPEAFRNPEPCVFILGDWLIQTDSRKMVERIAQTNTGARGALIDVPEYELVSAELGAKLDSQKPFYVSFMRGADFLRQFYQIASADSTKSWVRGQGENDANAKRFGDFLTRNDFPPFEEFEKYFAPSGTFAYNLPDGIHFGAFTLRADE